MTYTDRRKLLLGVWVIGLSCGTLPSLSFGQQDGAASGPVAELMSPATQRAADRGLAFLAGRQGRHGRYKDSFGGSSEATVYSGGVAVCGLAGLAFMAGGSPPGEGPYGRHVDRCVDFILKHTQPNGYISSPGSRDRMYGHGFATLFLAEAYGMSLRPHVGDTLRKAVTLIVATQSDAGGWRYQPRKADADLSITICQIMALRAARDAGVGVPKATRDRCLDYVTKSQNADGGFRYMISGGGSTFPLTGAGLVSLYSAGIYEGQQIEKGLTHLMKYLPTSEAVTNHYFYAHYYAVQATWHAGGQHRRRWYTAIRDTLIATQRDDGAWRDPSVGLEFGTAMACIILQMPNNYLPIFTD